MARDYVELFKQGLPRGAFWTRSLTSLAHQLYTGLVVEFERVEQRVEDLLLELDPLTSTEMLGNWEEALGLPDPEADPPPSTIAERQTVAHARWIAKGGNSRPYILAILNALGFATADIMFRIPAARPFICGLSECGAQPVNDPAAGFFTEIIMRSQSDVLDAAAKRELRRTILAAYQITDPDLYRAPTFAFPLALFSDATIEGAAPATFTDPVTGGQTTVPSGDVGTIWIDAANTEVALYPDEA